MLPANTTKFGNTVDKVSAVYFCNVGLCNSRKFVKIYWHALADFHPATVWTEINECIDCINNVPNNLE